MTHTIRGCRTDELPALNELANRIFRLPSPGDMATEYPLLFCAENAEQLRVVEAEGRLVAHVGILIRDASLLGCRVRVASIGAVCTDPAYRSQGLASALMADAAEHCLRCGASLMLISGGRGLYHRLGYVTVGRFRRWRAPSPASPSPLRVRPAGEADLDTAIRLQQREPVRFLRPRDDWQRLLAAGMLMNRPADLLLVESDGEIVAYAATQHPRGGSTNGPDPARVLEMAGSRAALARAAAAIGAISGADSVAFTALADDREWEREATRLGFAVEPAHFPGTLGVLDPPAFFHAIQPYLEERLGRDLGGLERRPAATGAALALDAERLELSTMGHLTAFLFGGDTEEARAAPAAGGRLGALLARAFPLPLLWYGYNYV